MAAPNSERPVPGVPARRRDRPARWHAGWLCVAALCSAALPQAEETVYGVLDLRGHPHAQFIYDTPRVAKPGTENQPPLYLHVPRDHSKRWPQFCHLYDACARPAWFVSEEWFYGVYLGRSRNDLVEPDDVELIEATRRQLQKQ